MYEVWGRKMRSKNDSKLRGETLELMSRLKKETKDFHTTLEALPYFNALIEHQLPLECYVNQLRALSVIHGVMENEISTASDKRVSAVWDDELRKLPQLEKDIAFFAPRVISDAKTSIEAAIAMTEKIRLRRIEKPHTLLGYLYVFEGSTLGNSMHRPDISKTFHLEGLNGCFYYSSYQDQVQTHWNHFSEKMNIALDDPSLHDSIIEAAHEAFNGLQVLYAALYPLEKTESTFHATRINPEAGNHPIPEDEREITAALKASDRGWEAFPYYELRYGERGKRFSDSDTCWLVTLTALDQETIQKQVDWLCRVLATRGMPTLMMEQTLRFLYEELSRIIPERATSYGKLRICADVLKESREIRIQETMLQSLACEFEQAVGTELAKKYQNTGKLLVSAVADGKNGIEGAVDALQEWLTDAGRFSTEWIRAVKKTAGKSNNHMAG